MCNLETWGNIGSILGSVASLVAVCVAVFTYRKNVKQEKIRVTVSDFPQLRKSNQELALQISDLGENERELCLKSYMSQMEHFAVGVNSGAYDLSTVNRMSGGMLVNQYEKYLRQFIIDRRERRKKKIEGGKKFEVPPEKIYCEYVKMMKEIYKLRGKEWNL